MAVFSDPVKFWRSMRYVEENESINTAVYGDVKHRKNKQRWSRGLAVDCCNLRKSYLRCQNFIGGKMKGQIAIKDGILSR